MISLKTVIKKRGITEDKISLLNHLSPILPEKKARKSILKIIDYLNLLSQIDEVAVRISPYGDFEIRRTRIERLVYEIKKHNLPNDYSAYVLATAQAETDHWRSMEEYHDGSNYQGMLGNIYPGDGIKYKGRGYVQLTGRVNYQKYTDLFRKGTFGKDYENINIINTPKLAENLDIAAKIAIHGMMNGTYTGLGLPDIRKTPNQIIDFLEARKIINGTDSKYEIAGFANQFYAVLIHY